MQPTTPLSSSQATAHKLAKTDTLKIRKGLPPPKSSSEPKSETPLSVEEKKIFDALSEVSKKIGQRLRRINPNQKDLLGQPGDSFLLAAGGWVRDKYFGKASKDIDFVFFEGTIQCIQDNLQTELNKVFESSHKVSAVFGRVIPITRNSFQSFTLHQLKVRVGKLSNNPFDDKKSDSQGVSHWEEFDMDLRTLPLRQSVYDDILTRDFCINSGYFCVNLKKFITTDRFLEDVENRRISCVISPESCFEKDYSRMLRVIRFKASLNLEVDPSILEFLSKKGADLINSGFSQRRLFTSDFQKLWEAPTSQIGQILEGLITYGLFIITQPNLSAKRERALSLLDEYTQIDEAIWKNLPSEKDYFWYKPSRKLKACRLAFLAFSYLPQEDEFEPFFNNMVKVEFLNSGRRRLRNLRKAGARQRSVHGKN